jgi:organic hydroperoxide reductase OsmC/OhrA
LGEYSAAIRWERGDREFADDQYSRGHEWIFDGGTTVPASASPHIVPLPLSVAENVDPEEAFVASLSSCHMLFFLSLAVKRGVIVDSYADNAVGYMAKDADGKTAMTRVVLRPEATYAEPPDTALIEKLHHRAHDLCFIANSVKTEVKTDIIA